jgi:uncharacterized membrane protein YciS (DUF1049 family)
MLRLLKFITLTIVLLCALVVGLDLYVRNHQAVTLNYYGGSVEVAVSILIAVTLLGGALLGIVVALLSTAMKTRRSVYPALDLSPEPADRPVRGDKSGARVKDAD